MFEALPSRRNGRTYQVNLDGHVMLLRTGEYISGRLGEIFLTIDKDGSPRQALMNCLCIATSMALQHGAALAEFADAFRQSFPPHGPVQGDDDINMARSCLDYAIQRLQHDYEEKQKTNKVWRIPPEKVTRWRATIGEHRLQFVATSDKSGGLVSIAVASSENKSFYRLLEIFGHVVSIGLKYGVPLKHYIEKFQHTRFAPSGVVTDDRAVGDATSVPDYLFRRLQSDYLPASVFEPTDPLLTKPAPRKPPRPEKDPRGPNMLRFPGPSKG